LSSSFLNKKYLRAEYTSRINRVIDYIEQNIDEELKLETLAKIANFSQFHFHRIFGAMMGETLNHFIQRIRIEKAAMQLINNPQKSITEIAFDCGFSSSATFARAFKDAFFVSASEWRRFWNQEESKNGKTNRNNHQLQSKFGKEFKPSSYYISSDITTQNRRINMFNKDQVQIKVEQIPEMHVAYVRHIGPYKGDAELFERLNQKLMKWAVPRGLLQFPETKVLNVYHDDPEITEENKLRTSVCITVPKDTVVDGEIGKMTIAGGKFAVARFELATDEFQQAWNIVFGDWLPESGYQPDDRLSFEVCHNDPREHPEHKCIVDICVPVKPL